ncbi:receptor expression-enhancing protein 2 [Amia ocellicauda]|uniref:receptor expression-enhancing protein 2 n=1 Tax=Amia ocellicauda TaxID=2972642 RepID=UPI0034644F70
MVSWIISRLVVLIFGTLYPAYSSYKAVKTKNVKEYVKWMMYWIVFAFFTTAETLTDIILSWFPFYFELKIAFVIWLLSPYTKGSSVLYRKFVHPTLSNKEKEIDEYITQARDRSYETMMRFGKRGLNLAASAAVTAATKGQGVLSEKLRSFSMQDLTLIHDEEDMHLRSSDPRLRSSAASQLDSVDDSGGGGSAPRGKARSPAPSSSADESHHSQKSDGDQSDARTEQSDEDAAEKAPKRVVTTKATKKPVAKTETQTKTVKRQPKKKSTPTVSSNTETA